MKALRKILYTFPAVLYCGIVAAIILDSGFGGFLPVTWVYVSMLILAAVVLCMEKWWGCIPGIGVGAIIIYQFETSRVHHHINETSIGVSVIVYFAVMGLMCYLARKNLRSNGN